MAMSAQCAGKENVLQMFTNRNLKVWSVWAGKQFLTTGSGPEELETFLGMIESGTATVYTLKVYKTNDPDDIDEKTAAAGSFNFYPNEKPTRDRFAENGAGNSAVGRSIGAIQKVIEEKIAERIGDILDGDEKPNKKSKLGIIGEILDHEVLGSIFEKVALQWLAPGAAQLPANINSANIVEQMQMRAVGNLSTDAELLKALDQLRQHDPKLTEHLCKLAKLADADKGTFDILIGSIDKMKIE